MTANDRSNNPDDWTTLEQRRVERTADALEKSIDRFSEPCRSCHGTGTFTSYAGRPLGPCYKCKGKGKLTFKTSPAARRKARESAAARKERRAAEALDTYREQHPDVMRWIEAKRDSFGFAASLYEAIQKYGDLTEKQLAAASRCAIKDAERQAARAAERQAAFDRAPTVDLGPIGAAFASASDHLKRPRLRIGSFIISKAPDTGKNAGALYVKEKTGTQPDDYDAGEFNVYEYRGKIADGRFVRSRETSDEKEAEILKLLADPKDAALSYGRVTGNCACCGRQLIVKESIERGIGPICAERWGFI